MVLVAVMVQNVSLILSEDLLVGLCSERFAGIVNGDDSEVCLYSFQREE